MSDNEREKLKQRRRALIKAAGAVPVVFSLTNGSPAAAASLTCADKTKGASAPYVTSGTDGWVRVSVPQLEYISGNGNGTHVAGYGFMYKGNYYTVNSNGSIISGKPNGTTQEQTVPNQNYYLLVDYGGSPGSFTVYPTDTNIGNPIAGASCWNSVNPNGPIAGTGNLI